MTLLRACLLFACTSTLFTTTLAASKPIPTSASSTFPQCGIDCSILTSAQDSCVAGTESTWTSCFCESSLLTSLKTSGALCSNCDSSDQTTLSNWYNSYCKSGGSTNTKDTTSTSTTATATTGTSTSTATAVSSGSKNATTEENKSWWSTHYQWVVMLIVLVIGFSALAVLGVWLKRRYEARHPGLYAPNAASSSGALPVKPGSGNDSGVLSPPPPGWGSQPPVSQAQGPGVVPVQSGSLASSSRTDIAPKGVVPPSRLQKGAPTAAADVEIRQLQR
ncbi:Integral membrane protein [Penicillium waksmanii]|uniref:Integral membrane protein n=1 Tax=Penicillium waksmanii TaxID=69791 RepID=UPI002547ACB9|nr:Integral membrane protein [Penicillium waksmanii]KAJ5989619.1 Integral membrane protein [Penicillium waksmanii]